MLKMKLEFFFWVDHLENTFGAYPCQAFACSCEKRWLLRQACFPSQAPWKQKCYNRSSRAIDVDAVDLSIRVDEVDHFYLLPCRESVTETAVASESTKRSAFSLRFHEHMMR
jgi:hypothetical protein